VAPAASEPAGANRRTGCESGGVAGPGLGATPAGDSGDDSTARAPMRRCVQERKGGERSTHGLRMRNG
jgi:hypothetical protein